MQIALFCVSEDIIEIQDVTFLDKAGEWGETEYTVQGSIMDGVSDSRRTDFAISLLLTGLFH